MVPCRAIMFNHHLNPDNNDLDYTCYP
jgi:hypothetical protein